MWFAVPVLVVVVVAGLWWALFQTPTTNKKPTPTVSSKRTPSTQAPAAASTLAVSTTITMTPQIIIPATFTPVPGPTSTIAPTVLPTVAGLSIGAKAKVIGTGGSGLNMRSAAGTTHGRVKTLREGAIVEIIGGPTDADDLTWWQVRDEAGITGWVASKFLAPQ
jgi:hypothetical protein